MPSGKAHDRLTLATAAVALPIWILVAPGRDPETYIAGVCAYLFSGYWLSGDLDTNSICYKRWGLFKFLWWPYRKAVPHRSGLSHGLVVGPVVRLLYFVAVCWILSKLAAAVINQYFLIIDRSGILVHARVSLEAWVFHHPETALAGAVGLILGGVTHSAADVLGSFWKKVW